MTAHSQHQRLLRKRLILIFIVVILTALARLFAASWFTLAAVGEMRGQIRQAMPEPIEDSDWETTIEMQEAADRPVYRRANHLVIANLFLDGVILVVLLVSMFSVRAGGSVPEREARQDIRGDQDRD